MTDKNKVTVYIPTKNRLELLKRAVHSVLAQTYTDWEIIIVNDASIDGTYEYLESIKSDKIKVQHQKSAKGACVARNWAIKNATGKFITGMDDDDYFAENRLKDFIEFWPLKDNKTVFLYASNKVYADNKFKYNIERAPVATQKEILKKNIVGNQIFTTVENLIKNGGFDENLKMWQDFDCWYRLLSFGNGQLVNNYSYYVDSTYREDRITVKNSKKLLDTYNYFCLKHRLSLIQRWALYAHFGHYGQLNNNFLRKLKLKIARNYYKYID